MKRTLSLSIILSAIVVLAFVATGTPAPVSDPIKVVFVKEGQIFYRADLETADIQLTGDDSVKFLPVWSKDGQHIAFVEKGEGGGLGTVVVIDERGRRLEEFALRRSGGAGIRFVESLEWVSPRKLAVSGSANPSLTETRLMDLDNPDAEAESIFDDGPGAEFSPDGRHFAYTTGSPHFTPERLRAPALHIDFKRVFPEEGIRIRFLTERAWSPDSGALAVVAEDVSTEALSLVIWRTNTGLERRSLALPASEIQGLFWSSGEALVQTTNGLVRPAKDARMEALKSDEIVDETKRAADMRQSLLGRLEGNGRASVDFWCESCALSASRRKVTFTQ